MGTLENLKAAVEYLKKKNISESFINQTILRNPEAFTLLSLRNLKALKRRLGIDGLIQALQSSQFETFIEMSQQQEVQTTQEIRDTQNVNTSNISQASNNCPPPSVLED